MAKWYREQEEIREIQRQKWRAEEVRQDRIDTLKRKYGNPLAVVIINSTRMVIKHTDRSQGRKLGDDFGIYFKRLQRQSILSWARNWPYYKKWIEHVDQSLTDEERSKVLASDQESIKSVVDEILMQMLNGIGFSPEDSESTLEKVLWPEPEDDFPIQK